MTSIHHHSHHRDGVPGISVTYAPGRMTYTLTVRVGDEEVGVAGLEREDLKGLLTRIELALMQETDSLVADAGQTREDVEAIEGERRRAEDAAERD